MGYSHTPSPATTLKRDEINLELKLQIAQWDQWMMEKGQVEATRERALETTRRILGWLHYYDNVPLESLRLDSIVPYIKTAYKITDFEEQEEPYAAWVLAREKAIVEQSHVANLVVDKLKGYLSTTNTCALGKIQYLIAVIKLAKFIYQNDTQLPNGGDSYTRISHHSRSPALNNAMLPSPR
jgi:hypothetical protein